MADFNPYNALAGGFLIGLAAIVLMAGLGRVMGASGIAAGLFVNDGTGAGRFWRWAFVAGMAVPGVVAGGAFFAAPDRPVFLLVAAGFLVGLGSRMGNGCTSGHGICGLSRLSMRSLVAVCTFMTTAALTVWLTRHVLGGP